MLKGRWVRSALAWAALTLTCAGAVLIALGNAAQTAEDAPLPTPFVASAGPVEEGTDASRPSLSPAGLEANELWIPSLGVLAPLRPGSVIGGRGGRSLEIPADPAVLTRYSAGAGPCDSSGTVVVAGHVSSNGVEGALYPLSRIAPNAAVYLTCDNGAVTQWQVVSVEASQKSQLRQDIFSKTGPRRAVIITCGGPVMPDGHYRDNILVLLAPATH